MGIRAIDSNLYFNSTYIAEVLTYDFFIKHLLNLPIRTHKASFSISGCCNSAASR